METDTELYTSARDSKTIEGWLTFTSYNEQLLYLHFSVAIMSFRNKERGGRTDGRTDIVIYRYIWTWEAGRCKYNFIILEKIHNFSENFKLLQVHMFAMSRHRPSLAGQGI
jgi:hypothetical protein